MSDPRIDTPFAKPPPGLGVTANAGAKSEEARAAREFEAVFLTQAIDEMLRTVDLGEMSGGHAEETWRSFLSRAIADEIAGSGATRMSESIESAITGYRAASELGD